MDRMAVARTVFLSMVVLSGGCLGDDDSGEDRGADAGAGGGAGEGPQGGAAGGTEADSGPPASNDGESPAGRLVEGENCERTTECAAGLFCAASGAGVGYPRFCVRDCDHCDEEIEECFSYTGRPGDAHCSLPETDAYEDCGPWLTTHCAEPLSCLTFSDGTGACFEICMLEEDDEEQCPEGETCLRDLLASETEGICGTAAAAGEACSTLSAVGCEPGYQCSADLDDMLYGAWTCRERCSEEDPTCEEGTCTNWYEGEETAYACY